MARTVLCGAAWGLVWLAAGALHAEEPRPGVDWPSFRGIRASGIAEGFALPIKWNAEKGEGIRWKAPIPGLGLGSPVIWRDRLFVTTAERVGGGGEELKVGLYGDVASVDESKPYRWLVICLDKKSGRELWRRQACEGVPKVKRHPKSSHASSSAATDGRYVVAMFGSEGLYCYDLDGKLQWKKDQGLLDSGFYMVPDAQWGFGSSPVIHAGAVIIQCDVQKDSYLAAYAVADGKELWRTPRSDVPTWSTPTVQVAADGATQVIVNGYRHLGGYDFRTGKELWRMSGGGDIPVPTPVVAADVAYLCSAHGMAAPVFAVHTSARGSVKPPAEGAANRDVAWLHRTVGIYMQTPLIYGRHFFGCRDNGVVVCFEAQTGEPVFRERLGRGSAGFTASAVAGDGKLYYTSEVGDVYVLRAGEKFDVLAVNPLDAMCMATPAISEGTLYFRTHQHVIAVGPGSPGATP